MSYNPGIEYRGDQYLFQGISQAGDAVKGAIKQWKDERKDAKATAKTLEAVGSGLSGLVEAGLLPPGMLKQYAQVQGAPASEQKAFLQGTGEVFRMFQQMEQAKGETAKLKMAAEQLGLAKESQALDMKKTEALLDVQKRQQTFGGELGKMLTGTPDRVEGFADATGRAFRKQGPGMTPIVTKGQPAQELTPELLARVGGQTGAMTPEGFTQLAVAAQRGDRQPRVVQVNTANGPKEILWDGANAQILPGPDKPFKTVNGPDGQPLFYGLPDNKGGYEYKPARTGMEWTGIPNLYTFNGKPYSVDAKGQLIAALTPGEGTPPPASGLTAPTSSGTVERRTINPQGVRVR